VALLFQILGNKVAVVRSKPHYAMQNHIVRYKFMILENKVTTERYKVTIWYINSHWEMYGKATLR